MSARTPLDHLIVQSQTTIPDRRQLTEKERRLLIWLLDHGKPAASRYRPDVDTTVVLSRCACGCPTILLGPTLDSEEATGPTTILADAHGKSLVEINGGADDPAPNNHHVRWGKYYRSDGTLGSEIRDGTGVQTYWYADGTPWWELELRDYKRVRLRWWRTDGTLSLIEEYDEHGDFIESGDN